MNHLSHGQEIVLRHHLADYPEDVTFDQICRMLEYNSEKVSIWVYFEEWNIQTFIDYIKRLAKNIDNVIVQVKENECRA